jgi:catechol 2,3-dioxygenase-like lactoylglutathione lyase family enzyme
VIIRRAKETRSMSEILGYDHVAITVVDVEATCAFYDRLFGAVVHADHRKEGRTLVRMIRFGGAVLSVHQAGNGVGLVARRPTPGAADLCFRWGGTIDSATALLDEHGLAVIAGPVPRKTADGRPAQSVYFHDPDANLIELMAAD